MKWVTRKSIHVNRTATAWLIRRFIDPDAELLFAQPDEVAGVQTRDGAVAGLSSISQGFGDVGRDDHDILERASFLYDALYAHLRRAVAEGRLTRDNR